MSFDLSGGGLFLSVTSLTAFTLACCVSWWFTTTELRGQMCSCGTGYWHANFTWGDDITDENYFEPLLCNSSSLLATNRCDAPWQHAASTRTRGHQSGALTIAAIVALLGASWFATCGQSRARLAGVLTLVAFVLQLTAHVWFSTSHLFDDLSYFFSCHFEFLHALNSNSLTCHALGPGWALSAIGLIFTAVASILFFVAARPTQFLVDPSRYSLFAEMYERKASRHEILHAMHEVDLDDDGLTSASSKPFEQIRNFFRGYGVPMMIMSNIALFLYSNLSTGATVEPHVRVEFPAWLAVMVRAMGIDLSHGNVLELRDDVFNFTLVSSLRHFWSSRAYALATLIGLFSGVWPYVKCFAMLIMWFVPASEPVRGRGLHWIDLLGKWSLIDSFFLCLMAVGFGFETELELLGMGIQVNIMVRPGWGVYSFVIATVWSLFTSHYLSHLHRHAMERRTWSSAFLESMSEPPHESLVNRTYAPMERRRRFKCLWLGSVAVWVVLLAALGITLAGQLSHTFRFTFSGLAQLILTPEKQVTDYSMVSIGAKIPHAAREGGYLSGEGWNWFLCIQFFCLAFIIPLLRLVLLMVLWSVPMTLKTTKRLYSLATILSAWSALDVFLVSIVAAVMEIGQLSAEVISYAFGGIEDTVCGLLGSLPPKLLNEILHALGFPSLDLTHGCKLFGVDATIFSGTWILFLAILASEIAANLVMEMCEASISERMAMLSAYHRSRNIRSPVNRRRRVTGSTSSLVSPPTTTSSGESLVSNNPNLRRLVSAQEIGSKSFVGSWSDGFYGPFPRSFWFKLVDFGLMRRVEWDQISQDLRPDLVEEGEEEYEELVEGQVRAPVARRAASATSDRLLERLVNNAEDDDCDEDNGGEGQVEERRVRWVPNSPAITH
ncbi:hypothetical protein BASA81_001358 [Batrachochytrium salamandrivorans]|nr:hypothetical protein BASA81_001358 [Batrachochytrium salamandrivorans]